ncbi:MAG: hypothetical protein C0432_05385 [Candidatus Puniceispirillum sp.]|nr:hypothetical protein [Candidatus Pelagibacter sp.]MBA4283707.1 hypothetical protein [Candidatus Puniceispirillum sp.]
MNIYIMQIFIIYIIVLFVTGCNPFGDCKPDSEAIVKKSWAKRAKQSSPDPLYCYSSLGDYVCYKNPQKDKEEILKGGTYEEERLAFPEEKTWWDDMKESWSDPERNNTDDLY